MGLWGVRFVDVTASGTRSLVRAFGVGGWSGNSEVAGRASGFEWHLSISHWLRWWGLKDDGNLQQAEGPVERTRFASVKARHRPLTDDGAT